jgi:Lon protease-like protein
MGTDRQLGLFPLSIALLPGEYVTLHIFEERYKRLFADVAEGGEFGVLLVQEEGLREIGCSARLAEVVERLEDGRLNVVVQGVQRFRLLALHEPDDLEAQYITATIEYVDDEDADPPQDLVARTLDAFSKMVLLMNATVALEPAGEGPLSFRLAAAVDFGAQLKQELLDAVSEKERLETLLSVMETLLPSLKLRKEREDAIRGNGKGY